MDKALGVCTPMCLDWTATRLSSVAAYGRLLPLYAATPSNPSTWAASRVGMRGFKTRHAVTTVSALAVDRPPRWQDQVGGALRDLEIIKIPF